MHNLVVTDSTGTVVWASHDHSLSDLMNEAADWLAHPEEDAAVFADGLWEAWRDGRSAQASCSHRGYTVLLYDEHAIQQQNR